jgi:hypothetical protein
LAIVNLPDGPGGSEGPAHVKAKVKVAQVLSDAGYTVEYERPFAINGLKHPFWADIFLEQQKVVVEVDGRSHWSRINMAKDRWKDEHLKSLGLSVIRLTVAEALGEPEQILSMLP